MAVIGLFVFSLFFSFVRVEGMCRAKHHLTRITEIFMHEALAAAAVVAVTTSTTSQLVAISI